MTFWAKVKNFFFSDEEAGCADHLLCAEIVREYDIRGIAGGDLFPEDAYNLGRAFGSHVIERSLRRVCVGYDCRNSSNEFARNLIRGLINSGVEVVSLGLCHTPLVYYAVHKVRLDAGIMVTGSHNPPEYNGFKFMLGMDPFYGNDLQQLADKLRRKDFLEGNGREVVMNDIFPGYIADIISDFNFDHDLKIAWDIGNGATSDVIQVITSKIPGKHHLLFEEMDGNFPNRSPDPIAAGNMEYLSKFVAYNGFDLGFAFDSDGDRLCVVDAQGKTLYSDQVLGVIATDFLKKNPGAQVIADVKSCNKLFEIIKKYGGMAIMERVGHPFIKVRMKTSGALLAGEMSGHFFFKDRWFGFDDGIYAALRCLEILSNDRDAFNNLEYGLVTPEIRLACPENKKNKIIDDIKNELKKKGVDFVAIDGIRVSSELGWWILRASNTQNALSLRIEAYTEDAMDKLKDDLLNLMSPYVENVSLNAWPAK
ncbi:MAG: phosphomannomutase/phosphoglucomutase [Holosporaceae bacterium]|jgi:phosphomannomutase|nr:phosphomannomutase/phosphoglucomutase [Holosporaceae bacterium]